MNSSGAGELESDLWLYIIIGGLVVVWFTQPAPENYKNTKDYRGPK